MNTKLILPEFGFVAPIWKYNGLLTVCCRSMTRNARQEWGWEPTYTLVFHLIDSDGSDFVMPAKAGIQEHTALASGSASWIPGLALLARNDAASPLKSIGMEY